MTYFIKTFGCQMNHSDSERIASFLESKGFSLSGKIEDAYLVVLNTCGIRKAAEDRVYSTVHNLRKKPSPQNLVSVTSHLEPMIVITGCIAHRKDVQKRLKDKVDLFFSISNFKEFENFIIRNLFKIQNSKFKILAQKETPLDQENIAYLSIKPKLTNNYQAFVPIMTGCNNFCSYCVVPYARGREISRPASEIIEEVHDLIRKGYKHIVLLGQNVNSYKGVVGNSKSEKPTKSNNPNYTLQNSDYINFSQLLKKIDSIPGNFWISFVSSHPKDMSDEAIEVITKSKKICEHIHLPIQAGNDEVLRRMNRKYTAKHYMGLVRKFKAAFKKNKADVLYSLTSDIIVGFPGETRTQFEDTATVMKKAKYDMVYFGQFSPRPGTSAWNMKDNVSKKEKERRENQLNEILKETAFMNNKKYVGKTVEVLVEKSAKLETGLLGSQNPTSEKHVYLGKTRTMKNIKIFSKRKIIIGSIIKTRITKANIWNLEGELT
jgi:tRNA-2-methylthio-N6-dimethylallyladenosine synthase